MWASVRARMCACTWMPATCFSSSPSSFLGVCVHMHYVNFFFIIFKGKSLSWVHVCLCAQACVSRIFFRGRCFWRMHVYTCSHDMHILYMDVCTLVEQLCCIQLLHIRAHAEQVLRGRLTFPFLISFFFFFFFFWYSSGFVFCWICFFSMRFCLFIHFYQCCFFRFCSYTLKFERATTWWISWKRCSLFLPILRKLLSNVHACEVMLVAHSTRLSIDNKMYLFYELLLGVHCSGFLSDKVWELFDARPFP